ncbi:hypothetical protein N0V93_003913 [Gnomoniopsis smithogilvyi]|uniref:Uncharacterized protein n=1 Tax=Gnomoniopsis smithogilvyi TaxID=1191159 RepID=A0A9W9D0J6_9PEZI|nr:hypothetical protein N0V93_003913 [Gnomoniopsis smithogilvyi]
MPLCVRSDFKGNKDNRQNTLFEPEHHASQATYGRPSDKTILVTGISGIVTGLNVKVALEKGY